VFTVLSIDVRSPNPVFTRPYLTLDRERVTSYQGISMASVASGSGTHKRVRSDGSVDMSDENGCEREKRKKNDGNETAAQNVAGVNGRKRLLFPQDCALSFLEKLRWAMQLGRDHADFEPVMKEGKGRPYLTVRAGQAVQTLTTQGYKGTVMTVPKAGEKFTKVIIFRYPTILDPDFLLDDDRFVWVRRHTSRGEERSQLVALVKGEVPEKVFISGAGYRRVAPYVEPPVMCLKCCRWGHKSWACQQDARCRFCGRTHDSRVCRAKIEKGERVMPCCCNCGGRHNAGSPACRVRPQIKIASVVPKEGENGKRPVTTRPEVPREETAAVPNAWAQGPPRVVPSPMACDDGQDRQVQEVKEVPRSSGADFSKEISVITRMFQTLMQRMDAIERKLAQVPSEETKKQKERDEASKETPTKDTETKQTCISAKEQDPESEIIIKGKERKITSVECNDHEKEKLLDRWEIEQNLAKLNDMLEEWKGKVMHSVVL